MTTADDETTKAVLDERGYVYIEGESILAEVDDRPGGMARLARALADADVNIYGHLFLGRWGDRRDVRVRGRRPGGGPPDPRAQGLAAGVDPPAADRADIGYARRLRARWALRSAPRSHHRFDPDPHLAP